MDDGLWMFAYGSLIWRPEVPFIERVPGQLQGYRRALAQGSTDHRGTPEVPGRVVTLLPAARAVCHGIAYRIAAEVREESLLRLDARESGGYVRQPVTLQLQGRGDVQALTYVAHPDNPNHLGEAPLEALAQQVLHARGPSGRNLDYVLELCRALRDLGAHEPELFALERRLLELAASDG